MVVAVGGSKLASSSASRIPISSPSMAVWKRGSAEPLTEAGAVLGIISACANS